MRTAESLAEGRQDGLKGIRIEEQCLMNSAVAWLPTALSW